jgi:hypothetical protein
MGEGLRIETNLERLTWRSSRALVVFVSNSWEE